MSNSRRPWLTLRVKSPFWRQVLLAAGAQDGSVASFPGPPGSLWRDKDSDKWVLGADGQLYGIGCIGCIREPGDAAKALGPMTRAGGA